jgi:hypothetical protein
VLATRRSAILTPVGASYCPYDHNERILLWFQRGRIERAERSVARDRSRHKSRVAVLLMQAAAAAATDTVATAIAAAVATVSRTSFDITECEALRSLGLCLLAEDQCQGCTALNKRKLPSGRL